MDPSDLISLPPIPQDSAKNNRRFHPVPPTATPEDLYCDAFSYSIGPGLRYIRRDNPLEILIFIDGVCQHHCTTQPRAGYGVKWGHQHEFSSRLEGDGPESSPRAELRAAIVALGLRAWNLDGFNRVVLACHSEIVFKGITEWVRKWESNGWLTARGKPVENQDLWKMLLAALRVQDDRGVMVQVWKIPWEQNQAVPFAQAGKFEERREKMGRVLAHEVYGKPFAVFVREPETGKGYYSHLACYGGICFA